MVSFDHCHELARASRKASDVREDDAGIAYEETEESSNKATPCLTDQAFSDFDGSTDSH